MLTLTRLSTGSHKILIDKLMRYWALMWADSWLNVRAHKIVISGTKSSWHHHWDTPGVSTGASPV